MKSRSIFLLLLWWAISFVWPNRSEANESVYTGWAQPQRGLPLITTFDVPPTRHNGEVWAFAAAANGQLWIGSDELSLFDGKTREKLALPFDTYAVRALAYDQAGQLWIGAIGEIGHLEQTPTGGWYYVSAKEQLQAAGISNLRDVWEAQSTPQGVVFVTDQRVLRWNGTHFEHWELPSDSRLLPTRDRDSIKIFQPGIGLLQMAPEGPRLTIPLNDLPEPLLIWALSAGVQNESRSSPTLLIGAANGIYLQHGGQWQKLIRLSAAVAGKTPWRATMLDDEIVAIGTLLGGLIVGSIHDELLAVIDRTNGLPNESINSLWTDRAGNLWTGYVGGMARIEARGTASVFDGRNGLVEAPILKVLTHSGHTYILSRKTLSALSASVAGRPASVTPFTRLAMPLSDAVGMGPNLWLSGLGGGLWRIADGRETQEMAATGYIFALAEAKALPSTLYFLENTRIRALRPRADGGWSPSDLSADVGAYSLSMASDQAGDLWVSTVTRGIFRFHLDNPSSTPPQLLLVRQYREGQGLPLNVERPVLTTLGGRIFSLSEQCILGYNATADAFVPVPGLESFVGLAGCPGADPSTAYWIVRNPSLDSAPASQPVLVRLRAQDANSSPTWEALAAPDLEQAGRISTLSYTADDGALWAAGSQTLVRLSVASMSAPPKPPAVSLQRLSRNDLVIPLPAPNERLAFGANTTRLRFELAGVSRAAGDGLLVQASLRGLSEEWSKPQREPAFDFTGLRPGDYVFRARIVDRFGRTGSMLSQGFALEAPWYQRGPAIAAYVLAGMLLILAGVRWRLRRLRRQNELLNQLVDERTRELARSNMVKNEFLENISHEIRNPLNGISNLVDLLRDAPLQPEERRLAQSLGRSTEHLKRVFTDVLGYTRLEYGHVQIQLAPFSLVQLLEDVVALYGIEAREQKTELSLHLPDGFVDGFLGDAEKIRAVVGNYVSNALKYAPGAPVEVRVRCSPADAAGQSQVWIGVCDHGPGLSADEQAKLFQKFSRGTRAKAGGIAGTGLGLATCRGLAELMDGQAGITSEEGKGATFWIELPLERAAPPPAAADGTESNAGPMATDGAHALIVDDQEYNQAVLRGIARRLGYTAEVASHADEVWPLIDQRVYATVFLDWELPGLNGGEIARKLRGHPNARNAVIIATTAHDNDDIRQQCLEAQMDGFALKPFDTARIRKIMHTARARRAEQAVPPAGLVEDQPGQTAADSRLNLDAFRDFAVGDPEHARQAVSRYIEALDQEIEALREAIARDDRETVARRAHRLRSHASLVNGIALSTAAHRLVAAARNPAESDWRSHTQAVFDEAAALKLTVVALQAGSSAVD